MPRPRPTPRTVIAQAIQAKRGDETSRRAAPQVGISDTSISRLERGGRPGLDVARKLAGWFGEPCTVERVAEAAGLPAVEGFELGRWVRGEAPAIEGPSTP